jgi:hypothetical protein
MSGVHVKVTLRDYQEDWEVTSELFVEAGQLDLWHAMSAGLWIRFPLRSEN